MTSREEEKRLEKLGAFEISSELLQLAQHNQKGNLFLNAGRGNPNWINAKARLAFTRIIEFGVEESERTISQGDLAGYIQLEGIFERFETFLTPKTKKIDQFLLDAVNYVHDALNIDQAEFIKELADGAIGNNYPVPSRILKNSERVINAYLESVLYRGEKLAEQTDLFPTEGGTAAIVYLFNSLKENKLIKKGDKIAINTPIFTPYLQIPELNDYELVEVDLRSNEEHNWQIQASEVDKLKGEGIKAFFSVNPSNPGAMAFNDAALAEIEKVIAEKPELMIITDDVYGTFVEDFKTIYSVAPYNTLLVYSYSKLFGATGWRLGVIAANKKNVFDHLINQLALIDQKELAARYSINTLEPEKLKFIDRMVADSRSVGLYHTAGLSTPQQIMEVLFSLTHLVTQEKDAYIEDTKKIIDQRYQALFKGLMLEPNTSKENSKYYALIDLYQLAEKLYGPDFSNYLAAHFEQVDFLYNLSQKNGVVLMDGVGFGTKPGELRVSEANLPNKDYGIIAKQILELLDEYHQNFLQQE
ncbi:bifunctional aspartate transaminase/aspartate 4-decarboxylase [Enterococcus pseudoavium]|uniref:bifunctional aspartate transaminase/aspartate 4-decarboxylase n=1 Tax=Enterococcus pseudoavium TaxID=44007 RepID=UPI000832E961|nr:bifunctional aspartate transaminase/aspartate 4-decarboxylase [Enterococcus pseudoavium]